MIEYSLKALTADELSFKVNPVKATPDTKFEIKPLFSRQIRHVTENPKINIVVLECKIESTEESPKPFNLLVRFANLTADALVNPLTLPVVSGATLFPDDRGAEKYTLNFDPKVVN